MSAEIVNVLIVSAGLALLWLILRGLRSCTIDSTRQDLYALRDEVFDYAMDQRNSVTFDSEAYKIMRSMVHGAIRYTHRMTLLHFLLHGVVARGVHSKSQGEFNGKWRAALEQLHPIDQQRMQEFRSQKNFIVIKHAARISPIVMVVACYWYVQVWLYALLPKQEASANALAHEHTSKFAGRLGVDEDNYHLGGGMSLT